MRDAAVLLAVAQIAVGLAGFTGVASVLDKRKSATHSTAQAERLRGMIEMALVSAGAALLPIVIEDAGIGEATAWRLSAACTLAVVGPVFVLGIRRAIRVNRALDSRPGSMAAWRAATTGLAVFITSALVACAAGIDAGRPAYLASLYALLIFSGVLFHRFFLAGRDGVPE